MNLEHQEQQEQREKYITMERDPIHILYCTGDHILGAELCELMNIHMATISNLKLTSVLKLGNCPILSKIDNSLPTKMRLNLFKPELTSLEDKIPLSYFKSMYSLSNEDIMNHIAQEIEVIADRNFIVYKPEFLNKIKKQGLDNMMYIADRKELNELLYEYEDIDYIKVNNNKYIVIY